MKIEPKENRFSVCKAPVRGEAGRSLFYRAMSRAVVCIGFLTIGILAVPAVVIYALISGVWCAADRAEEYFEEKISN